LGTSAVCSIFSASILNATLGKSEEEKNGKREKEKKNGKKTHTELIFHQCDSVSKNHGKTVKAMKAQPDSW